METIRNLEHLLRSSSRFANTTVVDHSIRKLTIPGENYGSLMLLVKLQYLNENNENVTADLIAKKIPESEWLRKVFKVQTSFRKELEFYNTIVPTLRKFQIEQSKEKLIDLFPEYCGGRFNLNASSEVDEDAVILLENLKSNGFQLVDRTIGFDKETTELILKNLAIFHAVPIALKLKKPDVFEKKLLPHLKVLPALDYLSEETEEELCNEKANIARENSKIADLAERVYVGMKLGKKNYSFPTTNPREPFATIRHNDFWVNNTMLRFHGDKAVENKMIDFQIIDYGSPAGDLVFFLFSSVELSVIKDNYDNFVTYYYYHFLQTLKGLNCDTASFDFQKFLSEIDAEAKALEFFHVMGMLKPIFAQEEDVQRLEDASEEDMKSKNVSDAYKTKAWFIIEEFAKRNWI